MTQRNEQEYQRGLDLLDDYRYGRLTAEDAAWMEGALQRWPELRTELDERETLAGVLRSGVAQGEAPVELPDAVLRAIEEQAENAGADAVPGVKRRAGGMLPWLSAAAALALVAVSLPVARKVFEQDRERVSMETRTAVMQDADKPLTSDDADRARVPAMARIPESVMETAKAKVEPEAAPAERQEEAAPADAMSLKAGPVASDEAAVPASEPVEAPRQSSVASRSSAMVNQEESSRKSSEASPAARQMRLRAFAPQDAAMASSDVPVAESVAPKESADFAPARAARPMAPPASETAAVMGYSAPAPAAAPAVTARVPAATTAAATRTPVPAATVVPSDVALKFTFGEFQASEAVHRQMVVEPKGEPARMLGVESTGVATVLFDDLTTAAMVTSDTLSSATLQTTPVVEVWK